MPFSVTLHFDGRRVILFPNSPRNGATELGGVLEVLVLEPQRRLPRFETRVVLYCYSRSEECESRGERMSSYHYATVREDLRRVCIGDGLVRIQLPFQLTLPAWLPPSSTDALHEVRYELTAVALSRSLFSLSPQSSRTVEPVTIYSHPSPSKLSPQNILEARMRSDEASSVEVQVSSVNARLGGCCGLSVWARREGEEEVEVLGYHIALLQTWEKDGETGSDGEFLLLSSANGAMEAEELPPPPKHADTHPRSSRDSKSSQFTLVEEPRGKVVGELRFQFPRQSCHVRPSTPQGTRTAVRMSHELRVWLRLSDGAGKERRACFWLGVELADEHLESETTVLPAYGRGLLCCAADGQGVVG